MPKLKDIKGGHLDDLAELNIDTNAAYAVDDFPQGGITNAQMTKALDQVGWYKDGDVFLCIDSGTYTQNKFYKYTVTDNTPSWVECQVGGGGSHKYLHTFSGLISAGPHYGTLNFSYIDNDSNKLTAGINYDFSSLLAAKLIALGYTGTSSHYSDAKPLPASGYYSQSTDKGLIYGIYGDGTFAYIAYAPEVKQTTSLTVDDVPVEVITSLSYNNNLMDQHYVSLFASKIREVVTEI